ncbi:MAG: hypothetical protein ACRD0V_21430 [Acidimicrobiales bacterium]
MDPLSLAVGGALLAAGALAGRLGLRRRSAPPTPGFTCGCGHGYGCHDNGARCVAEVERPRYLSDGYRGGSEWVACPCLFYDGPEPLPRVWTTDP